MGGLDGDIGRHPGARGVVDAPTVGQRVDDGEPAAALSERTAMQRLQLGGEAAVTDADPHVMVQQAPTDFDPRAVGWLSVGEAIGDELAQDQLSVVEYLGGRRMTEVRDHQPSSRTHAGWLERHRDDRARVVPINAYHLGTS